MIKLAIGVALGAVLAGAYPDQTQQVGKSILSWINSAATHTAEATREPTSFESITTTVLEPLQRDK
jgi:hypothetical protein